MRVCVFVACFVSTCGNYDPHVNKKNEMKMSTCELQNFQCHLSLKVMYFTCGHFHSYVKKDNHLGKCPVHTQHHCLFTPLLPLLNC